MPVLFAVRWNAATGTWKEGVQPPTFEDGYKALHGIMEDRGRSNSRYRHAPSEMDQQPDRIRLGRWSGQNGECPTCRRVPSRTPTPYLISREHTIERQSRSSEPTLAAQLIEEQIKTRMMASSQNESALTVIDPAEPTKAAVEPRVRLLLAGGGLLGLLLGVPAALSLWLGSSPGGRSRRSNGRHPADIGPMAYFLFC